MGPPRRAVPSRRSARRVRAALATAAVALLVVAGLRWARYAARGPVAAAPGLVADSAATLVVVLRPSDCGSYRPLMAAWGRLHREEVVRVVGAVVDGPGSPAARDSLERRLGAPFPLRFDAGDVAETLALRLGYAATPVSVLLDRTGRPRTVVPPLSGPGAAEAASRLAGAHLDLLGDEGGGP